MCDIFHSIIFQLMSVRQLLIFVPFVGICWRLRHVKAPEATRCATTPKKNHTPSHHLHKTCASLLQKKKSPTNVHLILWHMVRVMVIKPARNRLRSPPSKLDKRNKPLRNRNHARICSSKIKNLTSQNTHTKQPPPRDLATADTPSTTIPRMWDCWRPQKPLIGGAL